MLLAPELGLDPGTHPRGRVAEARLERGLVARRHRRGGVEPGGRRRCGVGVLALVLLPEVDARPREAGLGVEEGHEEAPGPPGRRPEAAVELLVPERAPGGLVGEQDSSRSRRPGAGPTRARGRRPSSAGAARALPAPGCGRASAERARPGHRGPPRGRRGRRTRGRAARRSRSRREWTKSGSNSGAAIVAPVSRSVRSSRVSSERR